MLELRDVVASYGRIRVLHGVGLEVPAGKVVTLLGANGAGKTTTLRVITGLLPATGQIRFADRPLLGLRPDRIVRLGISMVPESRELFVEMTVEENLRLGAFIRSDHAAVEGDIEQALDLFPRLRERYRQMAGTLSGGEQQMLTIARALMARPKLLILDEPSLGLAPVIVDRIYEVVREINAQGTTIVLVEQNANYALDVSHRGYVLETGHVALSDTSENLRNDERVQAAYLGA